MNQVDKNPIGEQGEAESSPADLVQQLLGVLIHRRWWFLGTASIVTVTSLAVMLRTPNRYTSEATIIVAQQQVPERYVVPTTTTSLRKNLETMRGEVLSRTRLSQLIDEFGLYAAERKRLAPEQVLGLMIDSIRVEPLAPAPEEKESDSFKVSFTAESPLLAQSVTSRLASLFILNDVKGREDQAVTTTKFLKEQLDATQKKLSTMEQSLRDFKLQHLGELPEQQQGNLAILGGLQTQLQNTMSSIAHAQQQKVYLESLVNTMRGVASRREIAEADTGVKEQAASDQGLLGAELRLARLQAERKTLLNLRGPDDPDVRAMGVDIARTEALVQKLRVAKPTMQKAPELEDNSLTQIKSQLEANRLEIENLTRDEKQLKDSITQYQNRLNQTPVREQQLAGLMRDIELIKQQYGDLLTKEQQSQLATTLEQQQGGQQFRLLEPPSLPTLPSSPKRLKLGATAAAAGLGLGFIVAFLVDLSRRAYYAEREVSTHLGLPFVVGIPLLLTPREERRRSWIRACEWVAACCIALLIGAAELVYLRGIQNL